MTLREARAVRRLADSSRTRHPEDLTRQVIVLRAFSGYDRVQARRMILDARAAWLDWLTLRQREWQTRVSRRPQRNRHADSWPTRERYVRCHG